jgi:adenylate kinase family enzyme
MSDKIVAMTDQRRLEQLISAKHPSISVVTYDEEHVLSLARQACIDNGWDLWLWTVTAGLRDGLLAGAQSLADTEHPAGALTQLCQDRAPRRVVVMLDLAGHLKDERTLRTLREAIGAAQRGGFTIVLVDQSDELPAVIRATVRRLDIAFPDETELLDLVKRTLRQLNEELRISVELTRKDLNSVIANLRGLSRSQARQIILDTVCDDRQFDAADIASILAHKRQALGGTGLLDYVEAPIDMSQIGGLSRLKEWLAHRQGALGDEAREFGITPPRGVLLLGVQGAGKSLAAKAIATAWKRPLLRMDVGALYDRYIGESERRLRDALRQAEMMSPIVLWIDEIEKGFASAAAQSSDGGLSKRMFGSLLTWMQEHTAPVFLVATANDIEALPPELLRKGRFDEIFFVDLPAADARRQIFLIHLQRRRRDPKSIELGVLVDASEGYSGAEIEQAVISALHAAFAKKKDLTTESIVAALESSPPLSVTMKEKVDELRQWSRGRCAPAD